MDVRQAVDQAKRYVVELFTNEGITNLGLEEVEFDDGVWNVTVGFSRPWDTPSGFAALAQAQLQRRSYKIVRIDDGSAHVLSVKNRELKP